MSLSPAELGPRIAAGVIDFFVLGAVGAVLCLGPLWLGGLALPMVGAVAAVVVVQVLPLAAFRATIGLRLMNLELVHQGGRAADLSELLFRELVGRGLLGAAFFTTLLVGGAGQVAGVMGLFAPGGLGLVLTLLAGSVCAIGTLGHLVLLVSKDRRGLHDMIGGTIMVPRGAISDPRDDEDLDDEAKAVLGTGKSGCWPKVVAAQVILSALAVAVPYSLSRPSGDVGDVKARLRLKQARAKFEANPVDARAASTYAYWLRKNDDKDEVDGVWAEHREAIAEQNRKKEAAIRAGLAENPKDWDRTVALIQLLVAQDRKDEAKEAFSTYARLDPSEDTRVSFGIWLYDHGFTEDAIREFTAVKEAGGTGPNLHAHLGWAHQEAGNEPEALAALRLALEENPDLHQVREDVVNLAEKLGQEPPPPAPDEVADIEFETP